MSIKLSSGPIRKRTVLYTILNGVMMFPGWAIVVTPIGAMLEPFNMGFSHAPGGAIDDFDPSDPICRVDAIQGMGQDILDCVLRDEEKMLHGGTMVPREFSKKGNFVV